MDFVTKRIACSSLSNSQFNWPAVSIPKLHVYHSKVDQSSEKRKWELVEFMIWWKLRKCFLLNAEIYIVSSNFFLSIFRCCCCVCLFIRSWCFVAVCVCVWSLVTKLYTSRNRWKQDKAINFSMPKCCERIVQPVDNMSLSWPTTVTERNGKKNIVLVRVNAWLHIHRIYVPLVLFVFGSEALFFCCGCKKSCPKSEIDLICSLYNIVIFCVVRVLFCFNPIFSIKKKDTHFMLALDPEYLSYWNAVDWIKW